MLQRCVMVVEGTVWGASPWSDEVLRVRQGGDVTHRVTASQRPFACALGGADRRTLFVLKAAFTRGEDAWSDGPGKVEAVQVETPGAGLP